MLKVPQKLLPYVDFEDGKIYAENLPDSLKEDFEELKKTYEKLQHENLTDY